MIDADEYYGHKSPHDEPHHGDIGPEDAKKIMKAWTASTAKENWRAVDQKEQKPLETYTVELRGTEGQVLDDCEIQARSDERAVELAKEWALETTWHGRVIFSVRAPRGRFITNYLTIINDGE